MLNWIASNLTTILIGILFIAVVARAIWVLRRDRKKGRSPCGCAGCSGCALQGGCRGKEQDKRR